MRLFTLTTIGLDQAHKDYILGVCSKLLSNCSIMLLYIRYVILP